MKFMLIVVLGAWQGYSGYGGVSTEVFDTYEGCLSAQQQVRAAIDSTRLGNIITKTNEIGITCAPIKDSKESQ